MTILFYLSFSVPKLFKTYVAADFIGKLLERGILEEIYVTITNMCKKCVYFLLPGDNFFAKKLIYKNFYLDRKIY